MQLSKKTLKQIARRDDLLLPTEDMMSLPERVLQFGTGVLLRGLPDYFIDKANRAGIFNGRIVVIKSTSSGGTDEFAEQDGLFTLCVRGIEDGKPVNEMIVNSSISRVISAREDWNKILECAENPELQLIISNTTEVGISLVRESINQEPPQSFPAKLLAILYQRYKKLGATPVSGLVIIPTELIIDNGKKLKAIVNQLAVYNELEPEFINWLDNHNHFCNSLVDRIVPGKLSQEDRIATESKLGYKDDLMIMSESFRLWAIESGDEKVNALLSFSKADKGVVLAPDIEKFRELKLRLLNGTHSFSCALCFLAGFTTVREAMADKDIAHFVNNLALNEIATAVTDENISLEEARDFGLKVIDRFRNPALDHQWISISVQYSSKMKSRNVPLILKHYTKTSEVPENMALGFAAYLLFMKGSPNEQGQFVGTFNGKDYVIQDDHAEFLSSKWKLSSPDEVVEVVLSDADFWGASLATLPGFKSAVQFYLRSLMEKGVQDTLNSREVKNETAGANNVS